jgi:hypothetical protein
MKTYFNPRKGFQSFNTDLQIRACKFAFLGNSVTAQKEGYAHQLAIQINDYFPPTHEFIFAGIGGIGSLASCFLIEDFVLRNQPDLCFVECTVADIGYATPPQYLKSAIEGIIQKLSSLPSKICFLHLYSNHTSPERADEVISAYEEVIEYYKIPSINVREKINSDILNKAFKVTEILYDGVHTTNQGALIYSDLIMKALISILNFGTNDSYKPKNILESNFRYTQIVLPTSLINDTSEHLIKARFRGLIKYIQMDNAYTFDTSLDDGMIIGFFIIADDTSGVIHVCFGDNSFHVQTYDQWCNKARIQAIILEKPVPKFQKLRISLTTLDSAKRGANGTPNNYKKMGTTIKFMGLMVAYANEPKLIVRLW